MNRLLRTCRWFTILVVTCLYGCSTTRTHLLETDRSSYYPLAVISADSESPLKINADIDRGPSETTKALGLATILTGGLLAPLLFTSIAYAAEKAQEQQEEFLTRVQSLESGLAKLADQTLFRTSILDYLNKQGVDAQGVDYKFTPDNNERNTGLLKNQDYAATLELSLKSVEFREFRKPALFEEDTLNYCLWMNAVGAISSNTDNEQIASEGSYEVRCMPMQEWLSEGEFEAQASTMKTSIIENVIGDLLLTYEKSDTDLATLQPITPKLLIDKEYINRNKPNLLKDYATIQSVPFSDIEITPTLTWEKYDAPGISNVRYDIRIYNGTTDIRDIGIADKLHIRSDKIIYSRDNLDTTTHEVEELMDYCSWYYWTVRAKFDLHGYPRMTRWSRIPSDAIPPDIFNLSQFQTYFPIRTPASQDDLSCWQQPTDWRK